MAISGVANGAGKSLSSLALAGTRPMPDCSIPLPRGGDAMIASRRLCLLFFLGACLTSVATVASLAGELNDALKARDVAQVRNLIAAGADINEKVQRDFPLNVAATFGPAEMVAILLDAGADIEKPGRDGLQPLHNAVILGQKDIVALLLQKGALVDAKDKLGRTPLVNFAARAGSNIEIPKMLLAAGADPNIASAKDDDSPSALQYAAETGNLELAELLLAARADVNFQNQYGWTPLHQAVENARPEIARLLIAHGADVNVTNKLGKTPLALATNDEMKQLLIAAGAR
jgi:ankyrin repeat protein